MLPPINTADLEAAVTEAETVEASVLAFISGVAQKITDAVTAALKADAAANQASIDAANAAIASVASKIKADSATYAAAIAPPAPAPAQETTPIVDGTQPPNG